MVKERHDITGSNCLKKVSGNVTIDEKWIKDSWKEYMKKLMNEKNEWDHRISTGVKEGPADCIRIDKVAAALKNMKRQSLRFVRASSRNDTSHRLSSFLTAHQHIIGYSVPSHRDIGTEWILDLCNGTVKAGCIPEDWKSSVVLPICKGKNDPNGV